MTASQGAVRGRVATSGLLIAVVVGVIGSGVFGSDRLEAPAPSQALADTLATDALPDSANEDDGLTPPFPMGRYLFGILRKGPSWSPKHTSKSDQIQAGHLANIRRMNKSGLLVAAGPCLDDGDLRGIFVFRADSAAEVLPQTALDPAIASKRLRLELYPWVAPAGIGDLYASRSQQPGFRDSMVTFTLVLARPGPAYPTEATPDVVALQERHVANVFQLLLTGRAATAGPLSRDDGSDDYAGVFVFRGDSTTARRLVAEDPAFKAGHLVGELHPWTAAWGTFPGDTL